MCMGLCEPVMFPVGLHLIIMWVTTLTSKFVLVPILVMCFTSSVVCIYDHSDHVQVKQSSPSDH